MKEQIIKLITKIIINILNNNLVILSIDVKDLILKRFKQDQFQNTSMKFKIIILITKNIRTLFLHI